MSNNHQSMPNQRWFFKIFIFVFLGLFLLARIGYSQPQTIEMNQTVLQGSIHLQPTTPIPGDQTNKIQPGTPIKLVVTVENKSLHRSPPGQLYVRYAFAHPLENETSSVIFETEKKPLPAITSGQQVEIVFDTPHQTPSVLDFVRYDWSIREYQAIAVINQKENIIGTLALTFSAYYYPGIKRELSTKIP